MATPFEEGLGRAAIERIARSVARSYPAFDVRAFVRDATRGLGALALKQRVAHVIAALRRHLPGDAREAIAVLVEAARRWEAGDPDDALRGFAAWPVIDFVGAHGQGDVDGSLAALRELTSLFSAELAIRELIVADPVRALATLRTWTRDLSEHVRWLVSEGTRTREHSRLIDVPGMGCFARHEDPDVPWVGGDRRDGLGERVQLRRGHSARVLPSRRDLRVGGQPRGLRLVGGNPGGLGGTVHRRVLHGERHLADDVAGSVRRRRRHLHRLLRGRLDGRRRLTAPPALALARSWRAEGAPRIRAARSGAAWNAPPTLEHLDWQQRVVDCEAWLRRTGRLT
jgi:3-methyladenine DNA glycosylase AlkC